MKKILTVFLVSLLACFALGACSSQGAASDDGDSASAAQDSVSADGQDAASTDGNTASSDAALPDGEYLADFSTDSSMFHVNETMDGKGVLTVENGQMTIHLVMPSENIVNLYSGLSEDAQKDGADLIEPTVESVTYDDGTTDDVYAFDLPVPVLDEEFDVALIGTHGNWYDHKVVVSSPEEIQE